MRLTSTRYELKFKVPGGTSRGILHTKETFFIRIESEGRAGFGECALFRGLSHDDRPDYEDKLDWLGRNIDQDVGWLMEELREYPSIVFGLEQAMRSLNSETPFELFPSDFTRGRDVIPINGLVWMGDKQFMQRQIQEKLKAGFRVIKLKIGALDFETEVEILKSLRQEFSEEQIEIRVDANGAFSTSEALEKLKRLSEYSIHSIEQPIKQGQLEAMAEMCEASPVPVALDEELIGLTSKEDRKGLLEQLRPAYLIFKPSLIGGMEACDHWISLCNKYGIGWWITSALESNIGLNAIAQYTFTLNSPMPQGLGTGGLFTNNIDSPLRVKNGTLVYDAELNWGDASALFGN
jgi:o-succinylbenzoate synthase